MTEPILTKREFATLKGWSPSYVTQLGKEGRLVLTEKGRVDVAATEQRLQATRDPGKDHVASRHAQARATVPTARQPAPPVVPDDTDPAPGIKPEDDAESARVKVKKLRELVATEMDRIDLGLIDGTLRERDAIDPAWAGLGVTARARLDAMIERLSPRLAACQSAAEKTALIKAALRDERRGIKRALISTLKGLRK